MRDEALLLRVEQALGLIKQSAPLHYARVIRELKRIWVAILPNGSAEYRGALDACVLDERYVADSNTSLQRIASAIIHEATHARLERRGIVYAEQLRTRIEAVCFRRELAFMQSVPDSAELREEISRMLEYYSANAHFFADSEFRLRDKTGLVDALRFLDAPNWLLWIVRRFARS